MGFKDHFSTQAEAYAQARPHYPESLYAWLADLTESHGQAWDCATGNGQAALGLVQYYQRVLATDASPQQIAAATLVTGIEYRVAAAEACPLADHSVDLVTVAQALHWFDLNRFHAEVRRVLKTGGVIAVWCYQLLQISPGLDALLQRFYANELGPYWPAERIHVERAYRDLPFPYREEAEIPQFSMQARWDLTQLCRYLQTWSAVQDYRRQQGYDPVLQLYQRLLPLWGEPQEPRLVNWPLSLRVGRVDRHR